MLSENLIALHSRLAEFRHSGIEMSGEGVEAFCAVLDQAVEDAKALEQATVPAELRCETAFLHPIKGRSGRVIIDDPLAQLPWLVVHEGGRS